MPQALTALQEKPFESQVWIVITAIGALRTLKSVIQGLVQGGSILSLAIDALILLIFVAACFLIYHEKIRQVPLVVALLLLVLLTASFVRLGGVGGTSEYNLMALSILFVMAYEGRSLVLILALYFLAILTASIDLHMQGWMTRQFFHKTSTSLDVYFTITLTLLAIFLYFKNALVSESSRILQLRGKLDRRIGTIRNQHRELEGQQHLLHGINSRLKDEITRHSEEIVTKNKAIQDFIWLSTESLHIPLQRITFIARDLPDDDFLESELKKQVAELRLVIHSLREELKQHERDEETQ